MHAARRWRPSSFLAVAFPGKLFESDAWQRAGHIPKIRGSSAAETPKVEVEQLAPSHVVKKVSPSAMQERGEGDGVTQAFLRDSTPSSREQSVQLTVTLDVRFLALTPESCLGPRFEGVDPRRGTRPCGAATKSARQPFDQNRRCSFGDARAETIVRLAGSWRQLSALSLPMSRLSAPNRSSRESLRD